MNNQLYINKLHVCYYVQNPIIILIFLIRTPKFDLYDIQRPRTIPSQVDELKNPLLFTKLMKQALSESSCIYRWPPI